MLYLAARSVHTRILALPLLRAFRFSRRSKAGTSLWYGTTEKPSSARASHANWKRNAAEQNRTESNHFGKPNRTEPDQLGKPNRTEFDETGLNLNEPNRTVGGAIRQERKYNPSFDRKQKNGYYFSKPFTKPYRCSCTAVYGYNRDSPIHKAYYSTPKQNYCFKAKRFRPHPVIMSRVPAANNTGATTTFTDCVHRYRTTTSSTNWENNLHTQKYV